jgi:hypothetical protein
MGIPFLFFMETKGNTVNQLSNICLGKGYMWDFDKIIVNGEACTLMALS